MLTDKTEENMRITESILRRIIRSVIIESKEDKKRLKKIKPFDNDKHYKKENLVIVEEELIKILNSDEDIKSISDKWSGRWQPMSSSPKLVQILKEMIEKRTGIVFYTLPDKGKRNKVSRIGLLGNGIYNDYSHPVNSETVDDNECLSKIIEIRGLYTKIKRSVIKKIKNR